MVFVRDVWPPHRYVRPFLGVGVLGGFTTFSTYMLESRDLLGRGEVATAFLCRRHPAVGLAAVWFGIIAGRGAVPAAAPHRAQRAESPNDP